MPPRRSQESKQGLVITLVICILLIIGLGVAAYYGFADQEAKDKLAKDNKKDADLFKSERDWYKFQAWLYCKYMGYDQAIEADQLAKWKDEFDKGQLSKGWKDAEPVKKVVDLLTTSPTMGWDRDQKKPKLTYEQALEESRRKFEDLEKKYERLDAQLAAEKKKVKEKSDELDQANKDFQEQVLKLTDKGKADLSGDRKLIDDLRNEIIRLGTEREQKIKESDEARDKVVRESKKKDTLIKQLRDQLQQRNEELASLKSKREEAPATMRTDWKIVRMDPRGVRPYINLGSADRVKPQLTFSIHSVSQDGRPSGTPKGTLEVVNVLGDHLSQAQITSVKDPHRDPILTGDVLYNPFWNPNLKKHVALAGLFDLSGGRDEQAGLADFIRQLERQDVVVDAWLDPKDYSLKGPGITVQTDYLILGEGLEFFGDSRDRNQERSSRLEKGVNEMKKLAGESGVQSVGLRKYLEMIGYRLPPSLQETTVSPLFKQRPDQLAPLQPQLQPQEKPEPKAK
jgi:hypothetical protein